MNKVETQSKTLDEQYPLASRLEQGWKLIDMIGQVSPKNLMHYPYGKVPVYQKDWSVSESKLKYSGAKLRALRAERGVGKIKKQC